MLIVTESTDIDLLGCHSLEGYSDESYALTYERLINFIHEEFAPTAVINAITIFALPKVTHGINKAKYSFKVTFFESAKGGNIK